MTDLRAGAQQALEALESSRIFVTTREKTKHPEGTEWYDSAITALQEALAQPEQEPSQWRDMIVVTLVREGVKKHRARELADHFAAQRPWQGLTPEEIKHLYPYGRSVWGKETYEAIEKALKERNHG